MRTPVTAKQIRDEFRLPSTFKMRQAIDISKHDPDTGRTELRWIFKMVSETPGHVPVYLVYTTKPDRPGFKEIPMGLFRDWATRAA